MSGAHQIRAAEDCLSQGHVSAHIAKQRGPEKREKVKESDGLPGVHDPREDIGGDESGDIGAAFKGEPQK